MSQMTLEEIAVRNMFEKFENKLEAMHDYNKARFAAIQSMLQAVVLHITNEREALRIHLLAMEPTVVPNEDEAMPVLASCPQCDTKAYTEAGIEDFFGWRKIEDGKTICQSWCRECRKLEQATSPRKKPTFWSKQCPIAKAHNLTVQSARRMQKQLKAKLETKLSPSERAATESRLAVEKQLESEHKSYYNDRIIALGYVHPNKAKRAAAKAAK